MLGALLVMLLMPQRTTNGEENEIKAIFTKSNKNINENSLPMTSNDF